MTKKTLVKRLFALAMAVLVVTGVMPAKALVQSENPLLNPQPVPYVETEDEFYNILLAGIDLGNYSGYWASGEKKVLEECHTDVIMVVSLNKTQNKVDLVSLPRDTLTYVPNVHGIYKLNAAFNCAETAEDGMQRTCDATTWLLGGVPIHRYIAVDMQALITLVDTIGGVDFNMDMKYQGHSGIVYQEGMQHLDGVGVMDYVRARKNATVDHNDVGRTRRGRDMIKTIFDKIQQNLKEQGLGGMVMDLIDLVFSDSFNIITNLTMADLFSLAEVALAVGGSEEIGSYVLSGNYSEALKYWNFTFTDQNNRLNVLREVYGIEAETIPYVSWAHTKWLVDYGFPVSRQIRIAEDILAYGKAQKNLTEAQKGLIDRLEEQYDATVLAFDQAAKDHSIASIEALTIARQALRKRGEDVSEALNYMRDAKWNTSTYWYRDALINDYPEIDWR